jgi:hypothetical protein
MPAHGPDYRQRLNNELQRIGDLVNMRYEFTTIGPLHEATWRATVRSKRAPFFVRFIDWFQYGGFPTEWATAIRNPRLKKQQHRPHITSYLQEANHTRVERLYSPGISTATE